MRYAKTYKGDCMPPDSRRGFLKLFGVGASIVPLLNGKPIVEATATIVEPPGVELAKHFTDPAHFQSNCNGQNVYGLTVIFTNPDGTKIAVLAPRSFVTSFDPRIELYPLGISHEYAYAVAPAPHEIRWTMEGICATDATGKIADLCYL